MKKKVYLSVAILLLAVAIVGGATMAWFTAEASITDNVFTAGTVVLNAEDSWFQNESLEVNNWNPGDCSPKMVTVTYEGSKRAFLRMQIEETWVLTDGSGGFESPTEYVYRDAPNVDWKIYTGTIEAYKSIDWATYIYVESHWEDWNAAGKWKYHADWWYYDGDDATTTTLVGTHTIHAISGVDPAPETTVMIIGRVCLDGPGTDNNYQGAQYTISATFQAIQASHADEWNWDDVDFETGLELTP